MKVFNLFILAAFFFSSSLLANDLAVIDAAVDDVFDAERVSIEIDQAALFKGQVLADDASQAHATGAMIIKIISSEFLAPIVTDKTVSGVHELSAGLLVVTYNPDTNLMEKMKYLKSLPGVNSVDLDMSLVRDKAI